MPASAPAVSKLIPQSLVSGAKPAAARALIRAATPPRLLDGQAETPGEATYHRRALLLQRVGAGRGVALQRAQPRFALRMRQMGAVLRGELQEPLMELVAQACGLGQGLLSLRGEQVEHRRLILGRHARQRVLLVPDQQRDGPGVEAVGLAGAAGAPPFPRSPARVDVVDRLLLGDEMLREAAPVVPGALDAPAALRPWAWAARAGAGGDGFP